MTNTKYTTALLRTTLTLLALLPVLLLAQTNTDPGETTVNDETSVEIESEITAEATANTNPSRPAIDNRPTERNANNVSPIERRQASSTNVARINFDQADRPTLEERQAQMEARRLEIKTNQTERKAVLQEKAQERISNFAASISHRMVEAIARIEQVIARIESRVEKIKAHGADTSEAESYLNAAKVDLNKASLILADIDTEVVDVVTSENPKAAWTEVRTTYQSARDAIRLAHTNIKNAVVSLKSSVSVEARNENSNLGENE